MNGQTVTSSQSRISLNMRDEYLFSSAVAHRVLDVLYALQCALRHAQQANLKRQHAPLRRIECVPVTKQILPVITDRMLTRERIKLFMNR